MSACIIAPDAPKSNTQPPPLHVQTFEAFEPYVNVWDCGMKTDTIHRPRTEALKIFRKGKPWSLLDGEPFNPWLRVLQYKLTPEAIADHIFGRKDCATDKVVRYFTGGIDGLTLLMDDLDCHHQAQRPYLQAGVDLMRRTFPDLFGRDSGGGYHFYPKIDYRQWGTSRAGRDRLRAWCQRREEILGDYLLGHGILLTFEVKGQPSGSVRGHLAKLPFCTYPPCTGRDSWNLTMLADFKAAPVLTLAEADRELAKVAAWTDEHQADVEANRKKMADLLDAPPTTSTRTPTVPFISECLTQDDLAPVEPAPVQPAVADLFLDTHKVCDAGQWVQYVKFVVESGVPTEDRLGEVLASLARWFLFVEMFGQDRAEVKALLRRFVLTKHNGKITRLLDGRIDEVLAQVDRTVDLATSDTKNKRLFAELRQKRGSGTYRQVYYFAPVLRGLSTPSTRTPTVPFISECLTQADLDAIGTKEKWTYESDLTRLPEDILDLIRQTFKKAKRQLRTNKTTGRCPTLDAITRLFNYLFSGRKSGTRRASQKLLVEMGFNTSQAKNKPIFDLLDKADLLHRGNYVAHEQSRQWILGKVVLESMTQQRAEKVKTA